MIYSKIRLGLFFLFIGLGIVLHLNNGISDAWYLYAAALLFLAMHFLFGSVFMAWGHLKRGDINKAELLLAQIKRPEWLYKGHKAYYHLGKGMIALQRKELEEGEEQLQKSIELGLKSEKDKALAHLNLAHISYVNKNFSKSKAFLQKAQSFQTDDLMVKDNLEKLEKALASI